MEVQDTPPKRCMVCLVRKLREPTEASLPNVRMELEIDAHREDKVGVNTVNLDASCVTNKDSSTCSHNQHCHANVIN